MIYLYAPPTIEPPKPLVERLGATLLTIHDGFNFRLKGKPVQLTKEDAIICWGRHLPVNREVPGFNTKVQHISDIRLNYEVFLMQIPSLGLPTLHKYETDAIAKKALEKIRLQQGYFVPNNCMVGYALQYVPHVSRFRFHVVSGQIVAVQRAKQHSSEFKPVDKSTVIPEYFPIAAGQIAAVLNLDIAEITFFKRNKIEVPVFQKLRTSPKLSPELVELYRTTILENIKPTSVVTLSDDIVAF